MTKAEALAILDLQSSNIPFGALEYLFSLPYDREIEDKIISVLAGTYDERVSEFNQSLPNKPLWYAILAEQHHSLRMVSAIIQLFTTPNSPDWDLLDEQGLYLIGKLSATYPEAVNLFLDAIEKQVDNKSNAPYLYLYDAIYHCNDEEHGERINRILRHPETGWKSLLVIHVAEKKLSSCKPAILEIYDEFKSCHEIDTTENQIRTELEYALSLFDAEESNIMSYYPNRGEWDQHYRQLAELFNQENPMLSLAHNNVGRNDQCPCGSGKKYKNCCLDS